MNPWGPPSGEGAEQNSHVPPFLRDLRTLVVALFAEDGTLLDANRGFLELAGQPLASGRAPPPAAEVFINPTFAALWGSLAPGRPPFTGILTVGEPGNAGHSLHGTVYPYRGGLLVVAEHDYAEVQRLAGVVLALNESLAEQQRALVRVNRELERRERESRELSRVDPLTGLVNRRGLDEALAREVARVGGTARGRDGEHPGQEGRTLALVMVDIDHFKTVNDRYGHLVGDEVLKTLGGVMHGCLRRGDLVARFGGEEFAVLLADTTLGEATALAERLRQAVARTHCPPLQEPVTASLGVVSLYPGERPASFLARADAALYASKTAGRNRVTVGD